MTSSGGGGFPGDDPRPDGPAEGGRRAAAAGGPGPHDDDPARLAPPADPWLTEASTSVLGDAASVPGPDEPPPADTTPFAAPAPLADTTPFAGPAPAGDEAAHAGPFAGPAPHAGPFAGPAPHAGSFAGPAPHAGSYSGWEGGTPPRRRRGRRATRWVVAVLAACALFVAGMLAIDQFGPDDGSDALGPGPATEVTAPLPTRTGNGQKQTPAADPPAATGSPSESPAGASAPATSANPGSPEVVYQVTASGSRNVGSVTYTDQDGDIIRLRGIPLPWRLTFPRGERKPLILNAQRKRGGDAGPVTCTITLDGKLLSSTTAEGRYASAQCTGSGR